MEGQKFQEINTISIIFLPLSLPNQHVMKRLLFTLVLFFSGFLMAQEVYQVDGESIPLFAEAEGTVSLLWNSIDGNYRYFLKKDNTITELKNTQVEGAYQEEYKEVLKTYVGEDRVKGVKLTRPDLVRVIDEYNAASDFNYQIKAESVKLKTRLGGFVGMTNYPYFINPDNTLLPQLGAEFEIIDEVKLKRHSLIFQFRQIVGNSDYDFSSSQITLNYRFKFVKTDAFDIYVNAKVAGYNYISQDIDVIENDGSVTNISGSGGEFQAPFALGFGADIALGKGYLTFLYQDVVALNLEDNGNFPVDIAVGYKFNL
jgi:hypothetical protein